MLLSFRNGCGAYLIVRASFLDFLSFTSKSISNFDALQHLLQSKYKFWSNVCFGFSFAAQNMIFFTFLKLYIISTVSCECYSFSGLSPQFRYYDELLCHKLIRLETRNFKRAQYRPLLSAVLILFLEIDTGLYCEVQSFSHGFVHKFYELRTIARHFINLLYFYSHLLVLPLPWQLDPSRCLSCATSSSLCAAESLVQSRPPDDSELHYSLINSRRHPGRFLSEH